MQWSFPFYLKPTSFEGKKSLFTLLHFVNIIFFYACFMFCTLYFKLLWIIGSWKVWKLFYLRFGGSCFYHVTSTMREKFERALFDFRLFGFAMFGFCFHLVTLILTLLHVASIFKAHLKVVGKSNVCARNKLVLKATKFEIFH